MSDAQPNTAEPGQEQPTQPKGPYDGLTAEQLIKLLAEKETRLSEVNHESASRRKRLDELEKAQAEADRAKMDELTRYKTDLEAANTDLAKLRGDYAQLLTRTTFEQTASSMKLVFRSETARADALRLVEATDLGDDKPAGMKKALEALVKERSYLFEQATPPELDATAKGKLTNSVTTPSEIAAQKRSAYAGL